ncbi:dTMP kinase [Anaerovorax odorimutans]|uniref:dTMP kinase n=1 Tax=Anaerovorax odorimutans TaxID=109327 RepID=UPI0004229EAC|nr:dTMP kinase [Anaerovorax odorimutans]
MGKGLFITFEGPDGSGKTTQIKILKSYLNDKGYDALLTREPGGTNISEKIRNIILDKNNTEMDYMTEALLYAASRAQHVAQVIRPALIEGRTVICDRFIDSSIVYQGFGRKLGDSVKTINDFAVRGCYPDITFLLKIDPSVGKNRINPEEQDRLEMENIDYHNKVYKAYMQLEKLFPDRIIGVDASKNVEEISIEIKAHIDKYIKMKK